MAKKTKKEGKIKNKKEESPIDVIIKDKDKIEPDWQAKTVEAESETKLESDTGEGDVKDIRFFTFAANPEAFQQHLPTAQELFQSHLKQIEIELWKDGWTPDTSVPPRFLLMKDKKTKNVTHYQLVVVATPAKGHLLSWKEQPKTLTELINDTAKNRH